MNYDDVKNDENYEFMCVYVLLMFEFCEVFDFYEG